MKTIIYFIAACFIATISFLGGLSMGNPLPAFIVGFVIWFLFIRWLVKGRK